MTLARTPTPASRTAFASGQGHLSWSLTLAAFLALNLVPCAQSTADTPWPTYGGGPERAGGVTWSIPKAPHLAWVFESPQPPRPAWPEPARRSYWQSLESISKRVQDDHVFQPVLSDKHVFFGSSADDTLRALDRHSGQRVWSFTAEGPIRYAPLLVEENILFGSDDGNLYCLRQLDGSLRWITRLANSDRRIPGNGRLISPWPVRTGLVRHGDSVFATAGLYPSEGTHAFRIRFDDGSIHWRQQLDVSPQGYLLASASRLIIPTGRATPVSIDLDQGSDLQRHPGEPGTLAVVSDDLFATGPGNHGGLVISDRSTGDRLATTKGMAMALTPTLTLISEDDHLQAIDRVRRGSLQRQIRQLEAQLTRLMESKSPRRDAVAQLLDRKKQELADCLLWRIAVPTPLKLAAANNAVVIGTQDRILGVSPVDGTQLWAHPAPAPVLGLALHPNAVVASTDTGQILCFMDSSATGLRTDSQGPDSRAVDETARELDRLNPPSPPTTGFNDVLTRMTRRQGIAVIAGLKDGKLLDRLRDETQFHLVGIDPDPDRVDRLRNRYIAAGVYGSRVSLHVMAAPSLPMTPWMATLVTTEVAESPWDHDALWPLCSPDGGMLWLPGFTEARVRGPLTGSGRWVHQYGNPANTSSSGDQWIGDDLQLQWFGGPGPHRMVDRHLRGPAPLAAAGRLFIPGENRLIAVDAYNGTELWDCPLPNSQRYSMPYDAGYLSLGNQTIAVAVHDEVRILSVSDGELVSRITSAPAIGDRPPHFGFVAWLDGDQEILATLQSPAASRQTPSREGIDRDYRNEQPVTSSFSVGAWRPGSPDPIWAQDLGAIVNPTLTLRGDRLWAVVNAALGNQARDSGRMAVREFLQGEAEVICLSTTDGEVRWRRSVPESIRPVSNILFGLHHADRYILTGSSPGSDDDSWYELACLDASNGNTVWTASHPKGMPGANYHGEQLHHPTVVADQWLLAEPFLYDLMSGQRIGQDGASPWKLIRPGHSCGTVSSANTCIFFRAGNPTVLNVAPSMDNPTESKALAPTRPGCWINMISAGGLLLVPEASAGCVCHFSLQTSMAFRSRVPRNQ